MSYQDFLKSKRVVVEHQGIEVDESALNPKLFPFQKSVVRWALQLGRAAIFAECGLGKTPMQLEWARHVAQYTDMPVLILAPLAVADQTVREGEKFGIAVQYAASGADVQTSSARMSCDLFITNYDRLHLFDPAQFGGVVLDESSILKNLGGKTFWRLVRMFEHTPFKLCCTATPAPNDYVEFSNHSTFLGIMHFKEVLARWFTGDSKLARNAVLKRHAEADWWRWLTSWAVSISKPSDLGEQYDMPGFDLPPLHLHEHLLNAARESIERAQKAGMLFPDTNPNSMTLHKVKRESLRDRVTKAVELVESLPSDAPCVVWCDTNYEADALVKALPEAIEVRGSQPAERKEDLLRAFGSGQARLLITKPDIAGFGLNWQHCSDMVFVGVSFSFEKTYQALRRSYRFGQTKPVNAHLIYAETEGSVMTVLKHKQRAFEEMQMEMNRAIAEHGLSREEHALTLSIPERDEAHGKAWTMYLGDAVTTMAEMPDNSVDFGIHSPPFSSLYIYSDSEADLGNSANNAEFFQHYDYVIRELYRITTPGRLCAVHCKDLPLFKNRDGAMGLYDFPGDIRSHFEAAGWVYHSRVTIWKDPVVEMERTNNHGLLHKNFIDHAEVCRQGMADYLVVFRKWSSDEDMKANGKPVKQQRQVGDYVGMQPPQPWEMRPGRRSAEYNYSLAVWQRYASPVWMDIDQTNVLNYQVAKDAKDEKHICPLQLDVIARAIDLWTNEGDVVFTPFAGIGSEVWQAVKMGRRGVGIELKRSYWNVACRYLENLEIELSQRTLFDLIEETALQARTTEEAI